MANEVQQPVEFTSLNITLIEVEKKTQTEFIGFAELDLGTLFD